MSALRRRMMLANCSKSILPQGYIQLEYIESTGTQYINTGYALIGNRDDIELDFYLSDNTVRNNIVGARNATTSQVYTVNTMSNGKWRFGWKNSSITYDVQATIGRHIVKVEHDGGIFKVDGVVVGQEGNSSITTPVKGGVLAIRSSQGVGVYYSYCKVYEYKMWRDGVLKVHLIPAMRNSDSVVGMYDIINDRFLTNSGTGTFGYGLL